MSSQATDTLEVAVRSRVSSSHIWRGGNGLVVAVCKWRRAHCSRYLHVHDVTRVQVSSFGATVNELTLCICSSLHPPHTRTKTTTTWAAARTDSESLCWPSPSFSRCVHLPRSAPACACSRAQRTRCAGGAPAQDLLGSLGLDAHPALPALATMLTPGFDGSPPSQPCTPYPRHCGDSHSWLRRIPAAAT